MPIVVGGGSGTPANLTFAQLKNQVLRYIKAPDHTELSNAAGDEINNAVKELNTRTWYWALTSEDLTLVADQRAYTLTGNHKSSRACMLLDASTKESGRIGYLDPKTMDLAYQDQTSSGDPCHYTVFNFTDTSSLSLSIPPSSSFVASYPKVRLRYHARVPILANASDTLPVPSEVEGWVIWKARYVMCMFNDPAGPRAQGAWQQSERIWMKLVADDNETHFRDWSE